MTECGDATKYTATVSQYFTIPELFAMKEFMYKHDTTRLLQMAHQKYDETGTLPDLSPRNVFDGYIYQSEFHLKKPYLREEDQTLSSKNQLQISLN